MEAHFGSHLLKEGDQIRSAQVQEALVTVLEVKRRPDSRALEKALLELRRTNRRIIDLCLIEEAGRPAVAVSVLLEPGEEWDATALKVGAETALALRKREPDLLPATPEIRSLNTRPAIVLGVRVVEEPHDESPSPVTGVVNGMLAWFDCEPAPERRLAAMARDLRREKETAHVSITDGGQETREITAIALIDPSAVLAGGGNDVITDRLRQLLGEKDAGFAEAASAFYSRLVEAGTVQKTTIARPVLASAYAPMKYDYMAGYLWMLFLGLIGLGITIVFARREKNGLIRKLGVEEAALE